MIWKKKLLENFNLYAVTSFDRVTPDVLTQIDRAYRGGAGILQLRLKSVTDQDYLRLALKVRQISRHYGRGFIINNRIDIALAAGADGIHVGQEDLPLSYLREIVQKQEAEMIIGKSTHSIEQAMRAEEELRMARQELGRQ